MPFQKVEYSFPNDEEETSNVEIEDSGSIEIDISGNKSADEYAETPVEAEVEAEVEVEEELDIEVVDDTPEDDRDRRPSTVQDITEEELKTYSNKVRKRLSHLSKVYHDERRAKESAFRERQELESIAQRLADENRSLKGDVGNTREALLEQAKVVVNSELNGAKIAYKDAYESGDADRLVLAQEELTNAKIKSDKLDNFKLPALQEEEIPVQNNEAPVPARDPKAEEWVAQNSWFHTDDEMTAYAIGVHQKLVKGGVDPQSDEYYETIDARMRKVFPEEFGGTSVEEPRTKRQTNVVAPATRSTAPKKVTLSPTSVAIAKKLGIPLEEYAKHKAALERNT